MVAIKKIALVYIAGISCISGSQVYWACVCMLAIHSLANRIPCCIKLSLSLPQISTALNESLKEIPRNREMTNSVEFT